jgi:hypothetical protein
MLRVSRWWVAVAAACVALATPMAASASTIVLTGNVSARQNIFEADPAFPNDPTSLVPTVLDFGFIAGPGTTLTVSASGTTHAGCANAPFGPDGDPTTVGCTLPLQGIFLPSGSFSFSAPNDFRSSFTSVTPALGQLFFIGDGLDNVGIGATGQVQIFNVPVGASALALGFIDAPTQFGDNSGSIALRATLTTPDVAAVPEPGSLLLLGSGVAALARRRRTR